jgi:hypothetical protein
MARAECVIDGAEMPIFHDAFDLRQLKPPLEDSFVDVLTIAPIWRFRF